MAVFYCMNYKLLITSIFLFSLQIFSKGGNKPLNNPISTIEFSFVGDIMCHSTQFKFAKVGDSYNFKPVYREIKPYFDNSDVVVGNLETVIEAKGFNYSGYPAFNTPKEFLEGLKYAGFDILTTANNHSFDVNEKGVLSTIKQIGNYGMKNVGSYSSKSKRDSVVIFEKNGIKYAVLSYTYGVNLYQIPQNKSYLVNRIDESIIKNDIKNYRKNGAEIIIVSFHFGVEYALKPNSYQTDIVKKTIDLGADIIIGAHPHSLQPIQYFNSSKSKLGKVLVAYSLGNFISNQRWRYSDGGAVFNFTVEKNNLDGTISLAGVRYLPIWVFKGNTKNGSEYIVLPTEVAKRESSLDYLSKDDLKLMNECSNDTHSILNGYLANIDIDSVSKSRFRKMKMDYLVNRIFTKNIKILKKENNYLHLHKDTLNYFQPDSIKEYHFYK